MPPDDPAQDAGGGESSPVRLAVGGYLPLTTIDFPGHLAAVVFLRGCPWRCPYCHNASLQSPARPRAGDWQVIAEKLQRRRGLLDGVVFSGGEPTAQDGLGPAMEEVRGWGFAVGLHTAGAYPDRLARVLPLVDWVGLDIKAPPDARYDRLCGKIGAARDFLSSVNLLRQSGRNFTLRTTIDERHTTAQDWEEIKAWTRQQGLPLPVRQEAVTADQSRI